MAKHIVADPTKCVSCKTCELACATAHASADDLVTAREEPLARRRIELKTNRGVVVPMQCRHCDDAPCIRACAEYAISRAADGSVVIDPKRCKGNGACVTACPFEAIRLVPRGEGRVGIKCDLCRDRVAAGLEYACVSSCPTGTLSCVDKGEGRYDIDKEACTACMLCKKACTVNAISGERKTPHEIDQEKCEVCGRCYQVCRFAAIKFSVTEKVS
jgi:carbon-monoxide dehydrogenase iron sulfur subunit